MSRGLASLLVLGMAAVSLALVPPASAAATWLPEVTASDGVNWVSQVDLAVDPAGNATAVWGAGVDGGDEVQAATRPVGAADFGPAQTVAPASHDVADVVAHPDGAVTVVAVAPTDEVVTSTRAVGTGAFPGLEPIPGGPAKYDQDVVVAVDARGDVTVGWTVETMTGPTIRASTRDSATGAWSLPEPVAPSDPDQLRMVMTPGGKVTFAWTEYDSVRNGYDVVAATRAPGAPFSHAVVDDSGSTIENLSLATNAGGVTAIAWREPDVPGNKVRLAIRPSDSATFPDAVPVPDSSGNGSTLALEVDSVGQATTAWGDSTDQRIVVVTHTADGTFAPPVSAGGTDQDLPVFHLVSELDRKDGLTLAWLSETSTQGGVFASSRPAGGTFEAVDIEDSGRLVTRDVEVAADATGDVTAVYDIETHTAGSDYVAARVLDVNGPSLSVSASASGATASLSAEASDVWSTPSIAWDFGDGTSGAAGTSTSHTYAATGSYRVRATASDASGNTTTVTTTVSVTLSPAVDRQAPTLSGAKVKPKVLPVKKAAKLVVTSSESATLKAVVERRRANGKWRPVAKKAWSVQTGPNRERLYGKSAQKGLAPGRYRIHLAATDRAGNVSAATTARFRVDT